MAAVGDEGLLHHTATLAERYRASLAKRPVAVPADLAALRAALDGPLPEGSQDARAVVDDLVAAVEPGLVASTSGRYFGFVEGGVLPAALAADWLASTWDQNPGLYVLSPAAAVVEEVCARWLLDLLGLPATASAGVVTGGQMANLVGLAVGRHHALGAVGWDVEALGLQGAPRLHVVVGEQRHVTVDRALRFLGLGERTAVVVAADDQGRMLPDALAAALADLDGPMVVAAQAGNVNTGAFDPLRVICGIAHERGAWVHVDGAFGLWAAASPSLQHLVDGHELADSWATDGHKWLNVPYDCGIVATAHPDSHRAAMAVQAAYLVREPDVGRATASGYLSAGRATASGYLSAGRDGTDWSPESSRRARAFPMWAALRSLGRSGVAEMVDRCCEHAARFADRLAAHPDLAVLNDVVLNQVLVRVGDDDDRTRATITAVQRSGEAWLGGTVWQGRAAMRISVSDHATTTADVDRTLDAIVRAVRNSTIP